MIYRKIFSVILFVSIFCALFSPIDADAADDDFDVEYSFYPEVIGYKGTDVQLVLKIENTGTSNITWFDVVVNTETTYSQRWTGTIAPGTTRTLSFNVPFGENDLDVTKILQVSMNNNSSANPDGLKMFSFQLDSITYFIDRSINVSPIKASYEVGDTVQITHTFTNIITTHALINAQTRIFVRINGDVHSSSALIDQGNIFPGESVTHVTNITFDESYIGEVNITSNIQCTLMGQEYGHSESFTTLTVNAPEPDIGFTANLSADPTEIESGETVMFTVHLENTGSDAITTFEIRNSEGGLMGATESMPSGGSGTVPLSQEIFETSDVSYVVVAYSGDYYETIETNSVRITVLEPESPTATATLTPTSSPTEDATLTPSFETSTHSSTTIADTQDSDSAIPSEIPKNQDTENQAEDALGLGLYMLVALLILTALAIITILIIIIIKKLRKKDEADNFE